MTGLAIRAEGLAHSFGKVRALDGVDLQVQAGTVFGLLGPNGAGKTTAVRVLSTLLRPDEGQAEVAGFDVRRHPAEVRRRIGLTGQYAAVDELLTGSGNLVLFGRLLGMRTADARARAAELLAAFDLEESADRPAGQYSGGMRRRLDLAISLIGRPQVLFLDEPTTGLDPRSRLQLWGLLRDLVGGGTTLLLTTQYLEEADQLADELAVIDHGRVIASGTPDQLKAESLGQVLEVRPTDVRDLATVAQALAGITGDDRAVRADGRSVTAPVTNDTIVTTLMARLREAGITVEDMALRRPTLDEVFLALTGDEAEAEEPVKEGVPA